MIKVKKYVLIVIFSIVIAFALLGGILIPIVHAQARGGPKTFQFIQQVEPTYVITDSVSGGLTFEWENIARTGTRLDIAGDSDTTNIDLGFYFPFYDYAYRGIGISTNGHVYFGGEDTNAGVVSAIPYQRPPNNLAAAFGSDLFAHPQVSDIYFEHRTAPSRAIIEFVDVQWCCGLNDPHTFEIILYPDGRILAQYSQIRYRSNPQSWVVVGIENAAGTEGEEYYSAWFNEELTLGDKQAVLFDPGDSLFGGIYFVPTAPADATSWTDRSETVNFAADLVNFSGVTTTFDLTYTLQISSAIVPDIAQWQVSVPTSTAAITNTGFDNLTFSATVPISADWNDLANLYITARSAISATVSRTLVLTYGVAQRDLQIGKALGSMAPAPGGAFRYQLSVTNAAYPTSTIPRGATAHGIVVTDTLPLSVTLDGLPGGIYTSTVAGRTVLTWNVGTLRDDETYELSLDLNQIPTLPIGTWLTNTAAVTMTESDERGPFDNNTIAASFQITEKSLSFDIDKYLQAGAIGADAVAPGSIITYTVSFYNDHNIHIDDAIIIDTLPEGTEFYTTTWLTHTYNPLDHQLVFTVPRVYNGYWNALQFQVAISVPEDYVPVGAGYREMTNTVEITAPVPDDFVYQRGDTDDAVLRVTDPRPNLWVQKLLPTLGESEIPQRSEAGGDYRYWINIGNDSVTDVYTITLVDTLPITYAKLVEASNIGAAEPLTDAAGLITWTIPHLAPGESGWANVLIQIDEEAPAGRWLVNQAYITSALIVDRVITDNTSVVSSSIRADVWVYLPLIMKNYEAPIILPSPTPRRTLPPQVTETPEP